MVKINGLVNNPLGLTSRICAELVAEANRASNCELTLVSGSDTADLKSIMNMMSLFIRYNEEFTIEISGENEEAVKEKMKALLSSLNLLK
jgi:phosphocarrier protein HPr